MQVTKTLRPGDRGTSRLLRRYGDRLVCVRYRFDSHRRKNLTTVELVVDERDALGGYRALYKPKPGPKQRVLVRIDFLEADLRARVKAAGGQWDAEQRGWVLPYGTAREMGLEGRIFQEHVPGIGNSGGERG
jgi:hypothetical protein